ncbi:MAG TPA: glycosyltransferase [Candidatus Cloacimonadota bacterium]|nr:glycosyltransferase [Candidatus Cloacimonadota bacterium]HPT72506.1 glycosyltransferase [Candidatus Cloacimonadota bacterium]
MSYKIAILTNSHKADDVRLYGKIATSLAKLAQVNIYAPLGIEDHENNPAIHILQSTTKLTYLQNAYQAIKTYRPDILICVEPMTLYMGRRLKKEIGCKLVYDVHEYFAMAAGERFPSPFNQLASYAYSQMERKLIRNVDLVIAVNYHLRDIYKRRGLDSISCYNYPTISECMIQDKPKQYDIVYVGGLYEERGILKILQAISVLKKKYPGFTAVFAGDFRNNDFKEKYFKTINDLSLTKHVLFEGMLPHCQIQDILVRSRIGICLLDPSIKRYRLALPIKVIEYLEAGLPVITNDFQQIREIIETRDLGFGIPYNSRILADKIDFLLQKDEAYFTETRERSRELVKNELNWETQEPLLLQKISALLPVEPDKRRLLLFAYFYPPLGGPGVQRPVKLTKYLAREGWESDVITVKNILFHSTDKSLEQESYASNVYRVSSLDPMSMMKRAVKNDNTGQKVYLKTPEKLKRIIRRSFPIDDKIGWIPFAYKTGLKVTAAQHYDAVWVTVGPYSAAIAAYKVARMRQLPLFIDYRDHWTLFTYLEYITKMHQHHAESWEKRLLEYAAGVTVISEGMKADLCRKFGSHLGDKIQVMYNGWDEDDFQDLQKSEHKANVRMAYVGTNYGNRTARYFIQALTELKRENNLPLNLEVTFIGTYFIEERELLTNSGLGQQLQIIDQRPHKEALEYMYDSEILALLISSSDGDYVLTGKIFEYLRCQRIILGMVPPHGNAADMLRRFGHDMICSMEDVQGIKQLILSAYEKAVHKEGEGIILPEFSREEQTKNFIHFMEKIIGVHS